VTHTHYPDEAKKLTYLISFILVPGVIGVLSGYPQAKTVIYELFDYPVGG